MPRKTKAAEVPFQTDNKNALQNCKNLSRTLSVSTDKGISWSLLSESNNIVSDCQEQKETGNYQNHKNKHKLKLNIVMN